MAENPAAVVRMRSRWWEDYLVRYFTGTLVGTFCIFVLVTEIFFGGDVKALGRVVFFSPEKDSTWFGLFVFILAGAAYCYLASVPITVFHSGRMIRKGMNKYARTAWYIWWGTVVISLIGATLDFAILKWFPRRDLLAAWLLIAAIGPAAWVFVGQIDVIFRLKRDQDVTPSSNSLFISFYRRLVVARDETSSSGIRESYSHLREHANSVFIVVIELSVLAALLLAWQEIGDIRLFSLWCLIFLLLWTSPIVLLWGLANSLELDLSRNAKSYKVGS